MPNAPLKLIFMGTPQFALPTLHALVESEHHVVAVYTQPPRPAGRGHKLLNSPVHEYALSKNIPVYTPVTLKTPEVQAEFAAHKADVTIVAAYGLLLPKAILEATWLGCINVHPSLLPRWRGAAPLQHTIIAGDKETAVVIMQMNAGLDTGDMLMIKKYAIADGTTFGMLHDTLAEMAGPMVVETLAGLTSGKIALTPQPSDGVTYANKITKEDCRINWKDDAHVIRQKILGLSPSPGAYFVYQEQNIKLLNAEVVMLTAPATPGTVIDENLTIACGANALRPTLAQRPGKNPLPVVEMLRGFSIPKGVIIT